jgi:predicted transcriptional regulator
LAGAGKYRSKLRIYADILVTIDKEGGRARTTRLLYGANLPHDRLKDYLDQLLTRRLIQEIRDEDHSSYQLTQAGVQFIQEFKHMQKFAEAFGFKI